MPERFPSASRPGEFIGVTRIANSSIPTDTLYAGGWRGLYRSRDCGVRWEHVPISAPADLADPSSRIWAVAVDSSGRISVGKEAGPILVSRDGGATWSGVQLLSNAIGAGLAADAPAFAIMLGQFHTPSALLRITDGGLTWERLSSASARVVATDARDPDIVYLGYDAIAGLPGALYRLTSDGQNRQLLAQFDTGVAALSVSTDGSRFWLGTADGSFYRSGDRGENWEAVSRSPTEATIVSLAAHSTEPSVVFVVTDGGDIWVHRE